MVEEDQENNFITRLHRGQLHILPWPVIKSKGFYTLFGHIRGILEDQPITHGEGGGFLHLLKTLMAKIMVSLLSESISIYDLMHVLIDQAHDWGALDREYLVNFNKPSLTGIGMLPRNTCYPSS